LWSLSHRCYFSSFFIFYLFIVVFFVMFGWTPMKMSNFPSMEIPSQQGISC
jgi:hypothetical protein